MTDPMRLTAQEAKRRWGHPSPLVLDEQRALPSFGPGQFHDDRGATACDTCGTPLYSRRTRCWECYGMDRDT